MEVFSKTYRTKCIQIVIESECTCSSINLIRYQIVLLSTQRNRTRDVSVAVQYGKGSATEAVDPRVPNKL